MECFGGAVRGSLLVVGAALMAACGQAHSGDDAGVDVLDGGRTDASGSDSGREDSGAESDAGPLDSGLARREDVYAFCVELSQLRCQGNASCCMRDERAGIDSWTSCDDASVQELCNGWATDSAVLSGAVHYEPLGAMRLLDQVSAALGSCEALPRPLDLSEVFIGTLPVGSDCTPDRPFGLAIGQMSCEPDLRCSLSGTESEYNGLCVSRGETGDGCTLLDCEPGLWCNGLLATGGPERGACVLEENEGVCGRDTFCRSRFCHLLECVEPTPADTWCSFTG